MKNSLIGGTAGAALQIADWNSVALTTASTSYVSMASLATFTPNTVAVVAETIKSTATPGGWGVPALTPQYGQFWYRFAVTGGGVLPPWIIAGAAVSIAASVTLSSTTINNVNILGGDFNLSGEYIVFDVDPNGLYFDVCRPKVGASDTATLQYPFTATALDSGSGLVATPLVTLIMQAQKVMFQCTSGAVSIANVVDHNGNAPYSIPLVPLATQGQEYEETAPTGYKHDLKNWYVKSTSGGSSTLAVRFL